MENAAKYGAVLVIVIAVIGIALYAGGSFGKPSNANQYSSSTTVGASGSTVYTTVSQSSGSQSSSSRTPVAVTDPAQVPAGTQAMVVSYSSVQVQNGNGAWVNAQGSGSVNLVSTVNGTGQVIAYANITSNTTIKAVQFAVNSAKITVNGTTYSVTAPSTITAQVSGSGSLKSNATILVDVSPVVVATYNQNTTTFVMSSSSKAVIASNTGMSTSANVGASVSLNAAAAASLSSATPSITITSAALASTSSNASTISVVVKNTGNTTVNLNGVVVYGKQNVRAQTAGGANATLASSLNTNLAGNSGYLGISSNINAAYGVAANLETFQSTGFSVSGSQGLLAVVNASNAQSSSYVSLAPGQSVTLSYSGTVSYNSGMFTAAPSSGSQYKVVVTGSGGATATSMVTAS